MSPKAKGADGPVRAAGGVVRRRVGRLGRRHVEVILIHRPRYDDWSFPKGKLDDGEGFEAAALREVEEETGLACRLVADLGETRYADRRGREKVVRVLAHGGGRPGARRGRLCPESRGGRGALDAAGGGCHTAHVPTRPNAAGPSSPGPPTAMSETPVYLVRHAKAGSRSRWDGADPTGPSARPDSARRPGWPRCSPTRGSPRIVTSPSVRCHQTVAPLGERLAVPVETSDLLSEGTMLRDALRVVEKMSDRPTVLCTHGDVVGELLDHLERAGVLAVEARLEKGSTWVLGTEAGEVVSARYLPPPA